MFIMGYQGGTVYQVADHLIEAREYVNDLPSYNQQDVVDLILDADYEQMQNLMRLAQRYRNSYKDLDRVKPKS